MLVCGLCGRLAKRISQCGPASGRLSHEWKLLRTLPIVQSTCALELTTLLRGSRDLVSRVIRTLIKVIRRYNYSYLTYIPTY